MKQWMMIALAAGALAVTGCDDEETAAGADMDVGMGGMGGGAGGEGGGAGGMGGEGAMGGEGGVGGGVGGMGGEGGMGGGGDDACVTACTTLADCAAQDDYCPGIDPGESRDALYDGCLESCANMAALATIVNNFGGDCSQVVPTVTGASADFAASCEGGGGEMCMPAEEYYPGDAWPECVSDDGEWVLAGDSEPSSIARVLAFEAMGDLLWKADTAPDADAFIDAQVLFVEDEGLGSRVARRYDSHIPAPEGADCRDMASAMMHPEYCVGPAQMLPIINDAFDAGIAGTEPWTQAWKIEAAATWFLYVSTYKEANSCTGKAKDCDSAWAYFGAGNTAADPATGLGRYVQEIDADAYAASFDALLAVRCWRDLDDGETAMDTDTRDRSHRQLAGALDHGFALLIASRLGEWANEQDAAIKAARWENLRILGHAFDRAVRAYDPAAADMLEAQWASDAPDADAILGVLSAGFACP